MLLGTPCSHCSHFLLRVSSFLNSLRSCSSSEDSEAAAVVIVGLERGRAADIAEFNFRYTQDCGNVVAV